MAQKNNDDKAFLLFSLAVKCALTSSELSSLNAEYIVIDAKDRLCIQFPVKNKTSRIIRLPDDISSLLNKYIDDNRIFEGAVFLNNRNTRLKVRDAQRILNRYIEEGIKDNTISHHFTFQDMRHAAFSYMLQGGATEAEVAQYGGITTKWLPRYRQVMNFSDESNTADYSIIQIKPRNKK
jgi:integrase